MVKHENKPAHAEHVLSSQIQDEMLALNLEQGQYYAFEGIGPRIVELCDGLRSVEEIITTLETEYEASIETIREDTVEFIEKLISKKLLANAK